MQDDVKIVQFHGLCWWDTVFLLVVETNFSIVFFGVFAHCLCKITVTVSVGFAVFAYHSKLETDN